VTEGRASGALARLSPQREDAIRELRAVVEQLDRLLAERPDDAATLRATLEMRLALEDRLYAAREFSPALELLDETMILVERALATDPGNVPLLADLARSKGRRYSILSSLKRVEDLRGVGSEHVATWRRLVDRDPSNVRWRRELAYALEQTGQDKALFFDDVTGALTDGREALAILDEMRGGDETEEWQHAVRSVLYDLGTLERRHADDPAALATFQRAVALSEKILARHPTSREERVMTMELHRWAGGTLTKLGRFEESAVELGRAVELGEALLADNPDDLEAPGVIAAVHATRARMHLARHEIPDAEHELETAVSILEKTAARRPDDAGLMGELAHHLFRLAQLRMDDAGRPADARAPLERARSIFEPREADKRLSVQEKEELDQIRARLAKLEKP
jgi:tetratricopeptide (TPR) repeat protein